jgi:hypothetical protein
MFWLEYTDRVLGLDKYAAVVAVVIHGMLRLFLAVFSCAKKNPGRIRRPTKPRLPAPTTAEPAPVAVSSSTTGR